MLLLAPFNVPLCIAAALVRMYLSEGLCLFQVAVFPVPIASQNTQCGLWEFSSDYPL